MLHLYIQQCIRYKFPSTPMQSTTPCTGSIILHCACTAAAILLKQLSIWFMISMKCFPASCTLQSYGSRYGLWWCKPHFLLSVRNVWTAAVQATCRWYKTRGPYLALVNLYSYSIFLDAAECMRHGQAHFIPELNWTSHCPIPCISIIPFSNTFCRLSHKVSVYTLLPSPILQHHLLYAGIWKPRTPSNRRYLSHSQI